MLALPPSPEGKQSTLVRSSSVPFLGSPVCAPFLAAVDLMKQVRRLFAALVLLFTLYVVASRPWFLSWGATAGETAKTLPGDELVPQPISRATRAITIHRPLKDV